MNRTPAASLSLVAFLALFAAAPAAAQVFTGRIEVVVSDSTGGVLPGALVELSGPQAATSVTAASGQARFLNLAPGVYRVTASLQGFTEYQNPDVPVRAGGNVQLAIAMKIATVKEQVIVTAVTPLIDQNKAANSTAVTVAELQAIPLAHDPWAVLQTVPAIVLDRVNVADAGAGEQGIYRAKGAAGADATWNLDGIPITDMVATGASPVYYDFETFQEMNIVTGGSDLRSSTGGVHLSLVLKSGTDAWRGSSRLYFENEALESKNMPDALAADLRSSSNKGNRIDQYDDYGIEVGGPIARNRAWFWGAIGRTDARMLSIVNTPDRAVLMNGVLKAQARLTSAVRASFTYFQADKTKTGRGAGLLRPPETTLNQSSPSPFYKGEVTFVVGSNLFVAARASHFVPVSHFDPQGGMNTDIWVDDGGVWHGSYQESQSSYPQDAAVLEGSYFHGRHELKFGSSWRRIDAEFATEWPSASGQAIVTRWNRYPNMIATVRSPYSSGSRGSYTSAWAGETYARGRLTAAVGVRVDRQSDSLLPADVPAVPGFERWLPALSGGGQEDAVVWRSVSPRANLTYAVDAAGRTVVRAGYALFASQLPTGTSAQIGVVQSRTLSFGAVDRNGNNVADYSEIDLGAVKGYSGFDITNPGKLTTINQIGAYRVPRTHEITAGAERQLFANVVVSGAFTWRKLVDFNWTPRIGVARSDYVKSGALSGCDLPDGSCYDVAYYKVVPALVADWTAAQGTVLTARPGYHQQFWGIELAATKRMSNRWMGRLGFSTNAHREFYDNPDTSIVDPTPGPAGMYINGGLVIEAQTNKATFLVLPRYQLTANGVYQAPGGVDLGANLVVRQGHGQGWYQSQVATGDPFSNWKTVALFTDIDQNRLPPPASLDIRASWTPPRSLGFDRFKLRLDLDVFNLFNASTVLDRQFDKSATGTTHFNQVLLIMNPRTVRLGARLSF